MFTKSLFEKLKSLALVYLGVLILGIVAAALLRSYVVEFYQVQSDAMVPSLFPGERVVVLHQFNREKLARGDVVVLHLANDPSREFVKRVVGLPADRVALQQYRLSVNGKVISGDPLSTGSLQFFTETFEQKVFRVQWSDASTDFSVDVPKGHVFVLSDSRTTGQDSRQWGFVRLEQISGKVQYVVRAAEHADAIRKTGWFLPL
jgi:signal peptidase I